MGEPVLPADTIAPVLALDVVPMTSEAKVVLTGRVMDDRGAVSLTLNEIPVVIGARGEFSSEQDLTPGRNVFVFVAVDEAGNQVMRSAEVSGSPVATEASLPEASPPVAEAAEHRGPPARFVDRGDGTLGDLLSGLSWTKRAEDPKDTFKEARSYCRKLDLGRWRDWQLPTIEEVEELFQAGTSEALQARRGIAFGSGQVWSSTKKGSQAWIFDFASARRETRPLVASGSDSPRVLCVRRQPRRTQSVDAFPGSDWPGETSTGGVGAGAPRGGPPPPRGGGGGGGGNGGGGNASDNSSTGDTSSSGSKSKRRKGGGGGGV